jgi:hypothetical protein
MNPFKLRRHFSIDECKKTASKCVAGVNDINPLHTLEQGWVILLLRNQVLLFQSEHGPESLIRNILQFKIC